VRYLGVSDGNMEEGSLRCDANVSVRPRGHHGYGVRTEVKNLNSMRHVEEALGYEIARHVACHERGVAIEGQTLRWDAEARVTRPMRAKEGAHDYRFMPEPDLGPITISEGWREAIRAELPEMPDARRERFVREIGLPAYDAGVLTRERPVADYFEDTLAALFKRTKGGNTAAQAKAVANVVMTSVLRVLNERDDLSLDGDGFPVAPDRLAQLVFLRHQDRISSTAEQRLFQLMLDDPEASAGKLADEHDLLQVDDEQRIAPIVEAVLAEHPDKVQRYLKGKEGLKGFFVGLVRKRFDGSPKPGTVHRLLDRELEKRRGR
jgi:aspartyl-tRNA(Asn)/glutamyl-tRNA(Gln) amidotransferase subunit B